MPLKNSSAFPREPVTKIRVKFKSSHLHLSVFYQLVNSQSVNYSPSKLFPTLIAERIHSSMNKYKFIFLKLNVTSILNPYSIRDKNVNLSQFWINSINIAFFFKGCPWCRVARAGETDYTMSRFLRCLVYEYYPIAPVIAEGNSSL